MTVTNILVKRYAEAFLQYARQSACLEEIVEQLRALKVILRTNSDFWEFLTNPQISILEKEACLVKLQGNYFLPEVIHLIRLLLEKGRIDLLLDICDYLRERYANGKTIEALLKTTYPLDVEVVDKIKHLLEQKLNKRLHLYLEFDPTLLGGVQIRVGNLMFDFTIRRRLEDIRKGLLEIQV